VVILRAGGRVGRLATGRARLEFERTKECRPVPASGTRRGDRRRRRDGALQQVLAREGHDVHLVDPVPLHIEHARCHGCRVGRGVTATLARRAACRSRTAAPTRPPVRSAVPPASVRRSRDGMAPRPRAFFGPGGHVLGVTVSPVRRSPRCALPARRGNTGLRPYRLLHEPTRSSGRSPRGLES